MNGAHDILVSSGKIQYKLHIRRNITIIRGDSSTGKTALISYIQRAMNPQDISVDLQCDVPVLAVTPIEDWYHRIENTKNSIIFLDENCSFVSTERFASIALRSTNYFVIVSRYDFPMLPYSVAEIYSLLNKNKRYPQTKQVYNTLYPYTYHVPCVAEQPQVLIIEDTGSGYDFFSKIMETVSAESASDILATLQGIKDKNVAVIADGAAFGAYISDLQMYIFKTNQSIFACFPESFEWLLLISGIINDKKLSKILESPELYIYSETFASWEQYFTSLLIDISKDLHGFQYTTSKLAPGYLTDSAISKVKDALYKYCKLRLDTTENTNVFGNS